MNKLSLTFTARAITLLFYVTISVLLFQPCPAGALEVPQLKGRINDMANLLSPEAAARLEQKLAGFEKETSNQVAVLTIP